MTAFGHSEIAQRNIAAKLEGDSLIGHCTPFADQGFAGDAPPAGDRYVLEIVAPDETVVPMAVAEILEPVGRVRLGAVIRPCLSAGLNRGAVLNVQCDIAAQPDG